MEKEKVIEAVKGNYKSAKALMSSVVSLMNDDEVEHVMEDALRGMSKGLCDIMNSTDEIIDKYLKGEL